MANPEKLNDIKLDFIIDYCKEHGEVDWLKNTSHKVFVLTTDDGEEEERKISFIELRNEFVRKFFPDLLPKKEKKKSMYELIDEL